MDVNSFFTIRCQWSSSFTAFFVLHVATEFMDHPSSVFLVGDLSLVGNNIHVVRYEAIYEGCSESNAPNFFSQELFIQNV